MRIQCGSRACGAFVDIILDEDNGIMPEHRMGPGTRHRVGDWCHMGGTLLYDPEAYSIDQCRTCSSDVLVNKRDNKAVKHFLEDDVKCDSSDHKIDPIIAVTCPECGNANVGLRPDETLAEHWPPPPESLATGPACHMSFNPISDPESVKV